MEASFSSDLSLTFSSNICRLCGLTKSRGLNVYSTSAKRDGLLAKINKRLSREVVHIVAGDGLPKFVCLDCQTVINNFTDFCLMVQEVQKKLLNEKDSSSSRQFLSNEVVTNGHDLQISETSKNLPTVCVGPDGKVECLICQTFLDAPNHTTLHMVTHGIGTVLCQCRICGSQGELSTFQHNDGERELSSVRCKLCHDLSVNKKKQPGNSTKNYKSHTCQICTKTFRSSGHLHRHALVHSGLKPYLCEICGTGFGQRSSLKFHVMSHMRTNPYKCQHCGQVFRFKVSLQSHTSSVHGITSEQAKEHECDRCGKTFVTAYKLRRHYRCHTGERPYDCKRCGRLFSQTGNLNLHCKKHEEDENAEAHIREESSTATFQDSAVDTYVVPLMQPHNTYVEPDNEVDPKFLDTILQEHSLTLLNKSSQSTVSYVPSQFDSASEFLTQRESASEKENHIQELYSQYHGNSLLFMEEPDSNRTSESVTLPNFSTLQPPTLQTL